MERFTTNNLIEWKKNTDRKPLIIHGARQVGKTWLMKDFGARYYKNVAYINFEKNNRMKNLFSDDVDVSRLLLGLEIETSQKIIPNDTLIIFDEIQECQNALSSLKYFYENQPQYNIISAGSLLGILLHQDTSFPVGKVEFMNLYPLNFSEFLLAIGEKTICELLKQQDYSLISAFKDKFIDLLRKYFFLGGMPEVVSNFSKNHDFTIARTIQNQILQSYRYDFSKHISTAEIPRVTQVWNSIPAQLAKENKKFIFKEIQKGAALKTYGLAIEWLINCGLLHKVSLISKPALPLKAYESTNAFKLYLVDIGLLTAMSFLDAKTLLEGDVLFTEFKGSLTEQFVCQELKTLENIQISYWTNEVATSEIDFILQIDNKIIPLEVKSSTNLKAKSLKVYQEKFNPSLLLRSSLADFKQTHNLYDIPLYALENLRSFIK